MRGKPWEWKPKEEGEDGAKAKPREGKEGPEMPEGTEEPKKRYPQGQRVRIVKADVRRYNPTLNCPGCEAIMDKRKSENHSEECRARFVRLFQETEEGRKRLNEADERRVRVAKKREADKGAE